MIDTNILRQAIEKWGKDAQVEMIEEECIELALAIQKLKRSGGNTQQKLDNVIDEIADVKIMITQAQMMFGYDSVQERIDFKMNRLNERLKE